MWPRSEARGFLLDLEFLFQEKLAGSPLAGLGTVLSTAMTGAAMYLAAPLTGEHVALLETRLFDALISQTDPIAVLEMLRRVSAPRFLEEQLASDSLFNDGVGAVLFLTILGIGESGHCLCRGTWHGSFCSTREAPF